MKKQIQIFKAGQHTAMSGASLSFSEAELKASAAAYDPAKHEAPIVIGHPKQADPAYGWVKSLSFADGLEAEPQQVDPAFAEMVDRGAFKKISASFYMPDSPNNPVPGVYYLRHVGFLGAQPPAVKGLRSPEFAEKESGIVEFADYDDVLNASLWRSFKNWLIGEKGLDAAEKVIPEYQISSLETMAQQETDDDQPGSGAVTSFSEKTQTQGDDMSAEDKARLATLEAENAQLKKDAASFAEAQAKAKKVALHTEHLAFAETLVKAGKLLPANKDSTVALLDNLASQEAAIEFGEGDGKKSETPLALYRKQLEAQPKLVEFKEVAGGAGKATASAFSAPRGYQVDPEKMETHLAALDYAEKNKCDYVTAVKAVENA